MPKFWIDMEDGSGNRLGPGPIANAFDFRTVRRLDKAGEFSFSMPAADPRAALIYPISSSTAKRVARCYAMIDGVETEIGSGVIDAADVKFAGQSSPTLNVSGDDLLRELTYRCVHNLANFEQVDYSPSKCFLYDGGTWFDLPDFYDDDTGTITSIALGATNSYLYVGFTQPFNVADIAITSANTISASNGYGFSTADGSFAERSPVSDGVSVSGVPFAQSGEVVWERPNAWVPITLNGAGPYYWMRWDPSAALDTVSISEITVGIRTATTDDLTNILAYSPTGWSFDTVDFYDETTNGTYFLFFNETVLQALIRTGVLAGGEHFRLGDGREVQWLRFDEPDSGIRCVQATGSARQAENASIGVIVDLDDMQDTYDLYTRVYPKASGNGETQADLTYATLTMPSGYTMVTSGNGGYIKNDAAETAWGQIEQVESFKDIGAADGTGIVDEPLANQLAQAALGWLQNHSEVAQFFRVRLTGLHQIIRPGETVHIEYRKIRDGVTVRDVDDDFVVLEATTAITQDTISTTQLKLASVARWPVSDAEAVIGTVAAATIAQQHPQTVSEKVVA